MRLLLFTLTVLAVVLIVALIPAPLRGQSGTQVYVGQSFDVVFSHDGLNTTTYGIVISGPVPYSATLPVSALTGGTVTFPVPTGVTAAGNYSIVATAFGDGGSASSAPFAFSAVVKPPKPSSPSGISIIKH